MTALSFQEREKLLAIWQLASDLKSSESVAMRNYALHVFAETRCALDQFMILPPAFDDER